MVLRVLSSGRPSPGAAGGIFTGAARGWHRSGLAVALLVLLVVASFLPQSNRAAAEAASEEEIALSLADMLRAARSVIADEQALINQEGVGDKGITGDVVVERAAALYEAARGVDPRRLAPDSRHGRLLRAQIAAVREVMNENQALINRADLGFKGFVPAVFARLVNERMEEKVGTEARIKVTAPPALVRNRKARPDSWESAAIATYFTAKDWPEGKPFSEVTRWSDRAAYRIIVPEYYSAGCLQCHGTPKGEIDVTGYPKEGGKLGELGGAISILLFRAQ